MNIVKLEDIVDVSIGKTPSRKNLKYWDKDKKQSNVWVSIRDMSALKDIYINDSNEYISNEGAKLFKPVPENTLIMSFKLTIGKLAITKKTLRTNEAIAALKIKNSNKVCNDYLYYFLSAMNWEKIAGYDSKIKGKTLNKAKLKKLSIYLPSLKKQQIIIARLKKSFLEIDKFIQQNNREIDNIKLLYESSLKNIFSNLNKNESKKTLKEISIDFGRGKSKHRPRNDKKLFGNKMPFVQTGDIRQSQMYVSTYKKSYNELGIKQSKVWKKGTVCITIAANIAEIGILDMDACFPDSVIGVYPNNKITDSKYLFFMLRYFQAYLKSKSKGFAQSNINLETFKNEKFIFPKDLNIQFNITKKINDIQKQCFNFESQKEKVNQNLISLKLSIIKNELKNKTL